MKYIEQPNGNLLFDQGLGYGLGQDRRTPAVPPPPPGGAPPPPPMLQAGGAKTGGLFLPLLMLLGGAWAVSAMIGSTPARPALRRA